MILLPDGKTFAIANGGIETHPDYGRAELNLEGMDPSLSFVDSRDGQLVGRLRLASKLSGHGSPGFPGSKKACGNAQGCGDGRA